MTRAHGPARRTSPSAHPGRGRAGAEPARRAAFDSDDGLRGRIDGLLRAHHTASVATVGRDGSPHAGMPHAATVFYSCDDRLRITFLSKPTSRHGIDIADGAPVAMTVAGSYEDWREIQGIQLWGRAAPLAGAARAGAFAAYVARFPFVSGILSDPQLARRLAGVGVYRFTPDRAAMTDNRHGLFGQELLDVVGQGEGP